MSRIGKSTALAELARRGHCGSTLTRRNGVSKSRRQMVPVWSNFGANVVGRDLSHATRLGPPGAAQGAARWNRIRPWLHALIAGNHQTRSLVHGTNLSAPAWMLLTQALATVLLMTRHRSRAAKTLGILRAMISLGYPGEESVRHAWRHPNLSITALTVVAELLAVSMAWLGLRRRPR